MVERTKEKMLIMKQELGIEDGKKEQGPSSH